MLLILCEVYTSRRTYQWSGEIVGLYQFRKRSEASRIVGIPEG